MPPNAAANPANAAPSTIAIDVTKDLGKSSDLGNFLTGSAPAVFSIGVEIAKYSGQQVQKAVSASPAAIKFQGEPQWKLPSGIVFSLTTDVNCKIAISRTSTKFSCKKTIDADDTMDVVAGPSSGIVYVNLDLDFDIKGDLSGSGTTAGIGIAGKASGSESATFSYCHPVSETTETAAAVKEAFAALVFPLKPDCVLSMVAGSFGKVNFDGALNVELDVTYGFGDYKLSAQNVGQAKTSVAVASQKLNAPSAEFDTGAKGSFAYKHTDNFSAIVQKIDANTARLFLVRSASNETTESAGVSVGIKLASSSASVNPGTLASGVAQMTKSNSSKLASQVASLAPKIESSLVSKANTWLAQKDVGLMASLSQEKDRTMLYVFQVDLSSNAKCELAKRSWTFFVSGDLQQAMKIQGFTLQPGSGVVDHLKNSSSIHLHFFNFQLAQERDFFENLVVKLGPDGNIRLFADVGEENKFTTQSNSTTATIHFIATASEQPATGGIQNVEVDFCVELSEKSNAPEARKIANCIGALGETAPVTAAEGKMLDFVTKNKSKTLTLVAVFKPSAYGKLSCSPYIAGDDHKVHPPALPQEQDAKNWNAFYNMVQSLMPDLQFAIQNVSYRTWQIWNLKQNDDPGADLKDQNDVLALGVPPGSGVPDRRSQGAYENAAISMFGQSNWQVPNSFLLASTGFMNLCDDLHTLANAEAKVNTPAEWERLIATLAKWVKADTNPDWSKPALGALLYLCSLNTSASAFDFQQAKDNSTFTCTLTLS